MTSIFLHGRPPSLSVGASQHRPASTSGAAVALLPGSWRGQYSTIAYLAQPTKRQSQADNDDYEPTLAAATKNFGDRVEITIRDNGGGIPAEVMDKIFNPFFTTKPPGEGTGLGLSLSHDIVVKQHGGLIEVDSKPGEFTEFKVILPRMAATSKAGADK